MHRVLLCPALKLELGLGLDNLRAAERRDDMGEPGADQQLARAYRHHVAPVTMAMQPDRLRTQPAESRLRIAIMSI